MWIAALITVGGVLFPASGGAGERSSRQAREAVRTTSDEARPFLGQWTSIVDGPSGPFSVRIEVRVRHGLVLATVDSDLTGATEVQDITNAGRGIALRYVTELWGYPSPVVIVLVPRRERLAADFSILNGQFHFSGLLRRTEGGPFE